MKTCVMLTEQNLETRRRLMIQNEVAKVRLSSIPRRYLFAKLKQDVGEFSHQVTVDGLPAVDVFELEEQLKGSA